MAAPSEYLYRIYNVNGSSYNVYLYIKSVSVERTGNVLSVTVDYYASGKAWNMWAYINGTKIFTKKGTGDSNTTSGSVESSITFSIEDSNTAQHTNEMSYSGGYQQQRSGSSFYANANGTTNVTSNPGLKFSYTVPAAGGLDANAISKITLLSGTTYDICDDAVRATIAGVQTQVTKPLQFIGITETELVDGSTTNPIYIDGQSVTVANGNVVIYEENELIYSATDSKWHDFGSLSATGALSSKNSATGTYTAQGTISQPTFLSTTTNLTVSNIKIDGNVTIASQTGGTINYTPAGTITAPGITVSLSTTSINPMTSTGALPSMTTAVSSTLLTFGWDPGSLPVKGNNTTVASGISNVGVTTPVFNGTSTFLKGTFSGSAVTGTCTIKPTGTISTPTFTGTGDTVTVS